MCVFMQNKTHNRALAPDYMQHAAKKYAGYCLGNTPAGKPSCTTNTCMLRAYGGKLHERIRTHAIGDRTGSAARCVCSGEFRTFCAWYTLARTIVTFGTWHTLGVVLRCGRDIMPLFAEAVLHCAGPGLRGGTDRTPARIHRVRGRYTTHVAKTRAVKVSRAYLALPGECVQNASWLAWTVRLKRTLTRKWACNGCCVASRTHKKQGAVAAGASTIPSETWTTCALETARC